MAFETFTDMLEGLPRFIEETYDTQWLHPTLGCLSPAHVEDQHARLTVNPAA